MSSREQYVAKLAAMGIPAVVDDVLCTSFAAARYLKDRNHSGKVYVVGNEGIGIELRNVGIEPVEGRLVRFASSFWLMGCAVNIVLDSCTAITFQGRRWTQ